MEVEINGKKTVMRMDLGAIKLANKASGKNLLELKAKHFSDADVIAALIYGCAHRGNKKITMDDVDSIKLTELGPITDAVMEAYGEFLPEGEGKGPLEEKPQP